MKTSPLDFLAYRRAQERAAKTYDRVAELPHEIGQRLFDHLELVRFQPEVIVDLGVKTGFTTHLLRRRYPKAHIIAMDIAFSMLQKAHKPGLFKRQPCVNAFMEQLPFKNHSVDMVFVNLELSFAHFPRVIQELNRILKPDGALFFSIFGPDTLKELRASWRGVDDSLHVHEWSDMHDLGDELVRAGFLDPVMEMEHLTLTYSKLNNVFRDLKQLGWPNIAVARNKNLTGKNKWQTMLQHYEKFRTEEQHYLATFEIIYGHAWARQQPLQRANEQGEIIVPLEHLIKRT